jgi:hypothetical protein
MESAAKKLAIRLVMLGGMMAFGELLAIGQMAPASASTTTAPAVARTGTAVTPKTPKRWDQQLVEDFPIYLLLIKSGSAGSGAPEAMQWEVAKRRGGNFVDVNREAKLSQLLKEYPQSAYADDASLLLARCAFLYHGDADGAIKGLYEVIQNYPQARKCAWIAEESLFLEYAVMVPNEDGWYGKVPSKEQIEAMPKGPSRDDWENTKKLMSTQLTYFEYLTAHPNWTEDEARYWIAWIIDQAGLKERMGEAEKVLKEVVELRRPEMRTKADLAAAKDLPNGEDITKYMNRTERKAHLYLIELLLKQGKTDAAKASAVDYTVIHSGHPSVDSLVKRGLVTK